MHRGFRFDGSRVEALKCSYHSEEHPLKLAQNQIWKV
jgi:hypothetical protein